MSGPSANSGSALVDGPISVRGPSSWGAAKTVVAVDSELPTLSSEGGANSGKAAARGDQGSEGYRDQISDGCSAAAVPRSSSKTAMTAIKTGQLQNANCRIQIENRRSQLAAPQLTICIMQFAICIF
jgi:hypothetical protein